MNDRIAKTPDEHLLREADSLGELIAQFRNRASPLLIGNQAWGKILACARKLPVTLASAPFGFELPLHDPQPHADFGISIVAGRRSGPFFGEGGRPPQDAAPASPSIGRMLDEMADKASPMHRIAGPRLMLEFELMRNGGTSSAPGFFLYPDARTFVGDGADSRLQDLEVVLDAIDDAAGWKPDAAERQHIAQAYMALTPETRMNGIGAFPSRGRGIRMSLAGFETAHDVMAFLERAGCLDQHAEVNSVVSFLKERDAFGSIGIHFDISASGIGPKLGLSFVQKREWIADGQLWTALIDGLGAQNLAVPEKLSELDKWSSGPEMLFGKSRAYMFIPSIHHLKYVLVGGRVEQVKAYVAWLLHFPP